MIKISNIFRDHSNPVGTCDNSINFFGNTITNTKWDRTS